MMNVQAENNKSLPKKLIGIAVVLLFAFLAGAYFFSQGDELPQEPSVAQEVQRLAAQRNKQKVAEDKTAKAEEKAQKAAALAAPKNLTWALEAEGLSGTLRAKIIGNTIEEMFLEVIPNEPRQLTVDEMVAGKKRVWLRQVDADFRNSVTLDSNEGGGVGRFTGQAKAYVQVDAERIRTVVNLVIAFRKSEEGLWSAQVNIRRGDRDVHQPPFVEQVGEGDFAIFLEAQAAERAPETLEDRT